MNQSVDEIEVAVEPGTSSSVGGRLASAREEAGMTVEEAASKLRLSVRQVVALETDDASVLPAPTFVRGFIRNYAKLLNLDPDGLLQAHQGATPTGVQNTITLRSENIPIVLHDKRSWMPYLTASALVGLALAGWMAYMEYASESNTNRAPEKVQAPVAAAPARSTVPEPVTQPAPVTVAAESAPANTPGVEQVQAPAVVPANAKLSMTFTQPSWVSVTDRDGKELLNKSQPAGSQSQLEGSAPLNVVIGNATGVQLVYNDKPVDLSPYTKANVARLTLE